jgi:hypothetical protein
LSADPKYQLADLADDVVNLGLPACHYLEHTWRREGECDLKRVIAAAGSGLKQCIGRPQSQDKYHHTSWDGP